MNFVETMSLFRIVSKTPLRCFGATPKICIYDDEKNGYALKIKKGSAEKRCLNCCLEDFCVSQGLRMTEDDKVLTIQSY